MLIPVLMAAMLAAQEVLVNVSASLPPQALPRVDGGAEVDANLDS